MDPVKVNPAWTTAIAKAWPYAQMDSNGGSSFLGGGPFTHDSITIRPRPSGAVNPWFSQDFNPKIPTSTDTLNYAILVTDYSQKYSDGSFGGATNPFPATDAGGALVAPNTVPFDSHLDASTHDQFTYPVVRVWYKGILQGTAKLTDVNSGDGCDSGNDMWFVGTLRDTVQPNALRTGTMIVNPFNKLTDPTKACGTLDTSTNGNTFGLLGAGPAAYPPMNP
jgi:hypothetical protein